MSNHPDSGHYYRGCKLSDQGTDTTSPAKVTCIDCLKKIPEAELSETIFILETRLATLVTARKGLALDGQDPAIDPEHGGSFWGWCVGCGLHQVDTGQGQDTCSWCLGRV
jgi:hypothetical protein